MARKSGFDKARDSVLKALRNFEEMVTGMVAPEERAGPHKSFRKAKKAKKAKKPQSRKGK